VIETVLHKWLRIPYTLNVHHKRRIKKPVATVLFIHGLGNSAEAWDDVIIRLPHNVNIITVDLLGFGRSPRPDWASYNAKTQARAVLATLLKLRITTPIIIVGHSLGSLVAIEVVKRYPIIINALVLCSPPLYDTSAIGKKVSIKPDALLRQLYLAATERPDEFVRLCTLAMKYQLINKAFNVTADNIDSYMTTLKTMIINQTSLRDAHDITVPTVVLQGLLDPFVVSKNLRKLAKANANIRLTTVASGHEIKGRFIPAIVREINGLLSVPKKKRLFQPKSS